MKRDSRTWIWILLILALAGITWLVLSGKDKINWQETYEPEDKNPYGTYIIYQLLGNIRNGQDFKRINDTLSSELPADPSVRCDNYIFIGNRLFIDSSDTEKLIDFIEAGNNAFILCDDLDNRLCDSLLKIIPDTAQTAVDFDADTLNYAEDDDSTYAEEWVDTEAVQMYFYDTTAELSLATLNSEQYPLTRLYKYKKQINFWTYLNPTVSGYDGQPAETLGLIQNEHTNFARIRIGSGNLFIHSTPLIFTNHPMLSDTAEKYVRGVFQNLGDGTIYWDEENRDYDPNAFYPMSDDYLPDEGPLEFILKEKGLRNAWYLTLLGAFLYLVFGARRKQRIIPITENMKNTSIEYAEVISQLFMKQKDHKQLILLKMELFRGHLRDRFGIRLPTHAADENDELFAHIATKTHTDSELIRTIFRQFRYLSTIEGVDTPAMLEFHQNIESFHLQSH